MSFLQYISYYLLLLFYKLFTGLYIYCYILLIFYLDIHLGRYSRVECMYIIIEDAAAIWTYESLSWVEKYQNINSVLYTYLQNI